MLEYLNIKNFALIDELSLPFHGGLTVLTGETGAGKSIIVDALQTVLGEKVDHGIVRTGTNGALVEASFILDDSARKHSTGSGELIVRREVPNKGRSRAFMNGSLTPMTQLRSTTDVLVDLHGQHEHQSLLKVAMHLTVLDDFAGLTETSVQYRELFAERGALIRSINRADEGARERLARIDYLTFVVKELESADLDEGEEEELLSEERILASAQRLIDGTGQALERVYQSEGALSEELGQIVNSLRQLQEIDGRLAEIVDLLEEARTQMDESSYLLRDYTGSIQSDPSRLGQVADRLALIGDMKKKYGDTVSEVLVTLGSAREELGELDEGEVDLETVRARVAELDSELQKIAEELSAGRRENAVRMEEEFLSELRDLAMEKVQFSVQIEDKDLDENGIDQVEFLISPNPGEPLMPLRKIASGGELSRVMLALKRILAGNDSIPTLVFDEVDSGIGGRVAAVLGRKLKEISRHHQVLCITHLAPVAAYADNHIHVEKEETRGRTAIKARYLTGDDRVMELARMMGGLEPTPGIIQSARELLEESIGIG
ncbi:MAG: DNA repair protein RecN [bacterium]